MSAFQAPIVDATPEPHEYYFRTALRFTTAAPRLLRMNDALGLSCGHRAPRQVALSLFEAQ